MIRLAMLTVVAALLGAAPCSAAPKGDADWALCIKQNDFSEAHLAACARITTRPKETVARRVYARLARAAIFSSKLDLDAALAEIDIASRLDGETANTRAQRGYVYLKKGQPDQAIVEFDAAIKADPKNINAFVLRGETRRIRGDLQGALADVERGMKLAGKLPLTGTLRRRADVFRDMGNYPRAIADYKAALALDRTNGIAYLGRGSVYEAQGQLADALSDYAIGVSFNPKETDLYLARASVYRKLGRLPDALRDYDTALALKPELDVAREGRAGVAKLVDATRATSAPDSGPQVAASKTVVPAETLPPKPGVPLASAAVGTRVALVVANAEYQGMRPLPNPVRDGETVARGLRQAGFSSVTVAQNLGRGALLQALESFAEQADKADWALVYFAGHGIEIGGVNYVVPVDAKLRTDRTANDEAVTLDRIIAAMTGAKKLRMVVLDACRDNPFQQTMRLTSATRSVGRGLSRIEPDGGTLVVYAAKHGQTALDGADDGNSPFVTSFARRIETPGVEIGLLFRFIRDDVLALTGGKQEPFVYGSLPGEVFYFRPP